jgi:type II secretory ATPase GspE/PulE/Tfp pilus assembly ATPase PilB-like protein
MEAPAIGNRRITEMSPAFDVETTPVGEVVERLIEHAIELAASDVFFCSNDGHITVLARHLGIIRQTTVLPQDLGRRCLAHVKTMAGMDANERRRPLDGRWIHRRPGGGVYDLRIETIPTLHGEDVAIRLLDRHSRLLATEQLGLLPAAHDTLVKLLHSPSGLILVTGPTGSGKTTTLYACLSRLNSGERKINTLEDPIEYALPGIRQSQVNHRIGLDFPDLLQAVLRQGPEVIMVGEVRDPVTAQTAVRAANSGHLVLATLHAPSAAGAVQSLFSYGVHPHHLASSLLAVLAQRLVRTLCPECKKVDERFAVPLSPNEVNEPRPSAECVSYQAVGCAACRQSGFMGRTGLVELLPVTEPIRRLIMTAQPSQEIHRAAIAEGMVSFRCSALSKITAGATSLQEVYRVVPAEYLMED